MPGLEHPAAVIQCRPFTMTTRGAAMERTVIVVDDDGSIAIACAA